jgi:hypothetical protein
MFVSGGVGVGLCVADSVDVAGEAPFDAPADFLDGTSLGFSFWHVGAGLLEVGGHVRVEFSNPFGEPDRFCPSNEKGQLFSAGTRTRYLGNLGPGHGLPGSEQDPHGCTNPAVEPRTAQLSVVQREHDPSDPLRIKEVGLTNTVMGAGIHPRSLATGASDGTSQHRPVHEAAPWFTHSVARPAPVRRATHAMARLMPALVVGKLWISTNSPVLAVPPPSLNAGHVVRAVVGRYQSG